MTTFAIDATQVEGFAAAMSRAPELVRRELALATTQVLTEGVKLAQGFAPVRTGALRSSIHITSNSGLSGAYGTSKIYARMREHGGTIHGNPWLVFQVNGQWVKVRSVTQRGTRYMGRSSDALRPRARRIYAEAMDRVWDRIMARGG